MIEPDVIQEKLRGEESPITEFKRDWYWDDQTPPDEKAKKWGELIKDIASLANGYTGFAGQDRYLIVGYSERESKVYPVNKSSAKELSDLRQLKRVLLQKLESAVRPTPVNIELEYVDIGVDQVLAIRIPAPRHLVEITTDLQTKSIVVQRGAVLIRKGQAKDEVRLASHPELDAFKAELSLLPAAESNAAPAKNVVQERSIAKTVQLYINKNASFSIDLGYPIVHRDWVDNIVFELFKVTEALGGSKCFLYVHEAASQSKTLGYLRKNGLLPAGTPLVVLTERPDLKETEKRKENLRTVFSTSNVFFIDEFGRTHLYNEHIVEYRPYNLPVYVEGLSGSSVGGDDTAIESLRRWYASVSSPLMVVKGYGGIGKTTLVKQFLDEVHRNNQETGILFIDSNEIIGELEKIARSRQKIDDIYDFYLAQAENEGSDGKSFSRDLLSLSVDNGSLVLVLDGIDEVIAKLSTKFDVLGFIESISTSYTTNLRRSKIIITCRDHFWDSLGDHRGIEQITLQPFSRELAEEFFSKSLDSSKFRVEKALAFADKLALRPREDPEAAAIYIPYVLDMIAYLVRHQAEFGSDNVVGGFDSTLLDPKVSNDFLVGSVCQREVAKLHSLDVESQVAFFLELSVARDGHVSLYDVKSLLGGVGGLSLAVSDDVVERLKGHPLLVCRDNRLHFRYDFFNEYFRSLFIYKIIKERNLELVTDRFVDVAANYLRFDGELMNSIADRLTYSDETALFAIEAMETIRANAVQAQDLASLDRQRRATSGLFCLLLTLRRDLASGRLHLEEWTDLMMNFFSKDGEIVGLSLVDVGTSKSAKPIFDFRGKELRDCYFERYDFFWECPMDESTRFKSSVFRMLEPRKD